ncbi:hypothetical protein EF294_07380 [Gordonia oryzae]|uniref:Uncharacterized protein n=1 Tax=Gordonia oryzae TaxID=2487349 RepID=A0A3N4GW10_9ACTN|nr:hypothetical protein [Gordonia oryzae]RPA64896.1 hypothetical protein EF294_07380 [Gordonia oryzae]
MTTPTLDDLKCARETNRRLMLALCGTCASVRRVVQPRGRDTRDETARLKCAECQRITVHALVTGSDHDEQIAAASLGMPTEEGAQNHSLMDRYRNGFTVNPNLRHWWSVTRATTARERGESTIRVYCGELVMLPAESEITMAAAGPVGPEGDTLDGRGYDPDDHGEWRSMDCTNCLRMLNHVRMIRRRERLLDLMAKVVADLHNPARVTAYDQHTEALIDALSAVRPEGQ